MLSAVLYTPNKSINGLERTDVCRRRESVLILCLEIDSLLFSPFDFFTLSRTKNISVVFHEIVFRNDWQTAPIKHVHIKKIYVIIFLRKLRAYIEFRSKWPTNANDLTNITQKCVWLARVVEWKKNVMYKKASRINNANVCWICEIESESSKCMQRKCISHCVHCTYMFIFRAFKWHNSRRA